MIDLVFNNLTADKKHGNVFFGKILSVSSKEIGLESKKIELSINLVGEGKIKALNKKYRNKNKTTDVLSFPLQDKNSVKSLQNDIMSLGDIFICLPIAKKYAIREGVTLDFKLSFLTVHGFLHLLNYDHEKSSAEEERMFGLQNKISAKLGF